MWRPYRTRDDLLGLTWGDAPGWYRLSLWDKGMTAGGLEGRGFGACGGGESALTGWVQRIWRI